MCKPFSQSGSTSIVKAYCEAESSLPRPPRVSVSPGKLLKGPLLGKGGYGLVFRATHASGAEFALKQMHKARLASRKSLGAEVAMREVRAFEELPPHPFVVRWHQAWQDERSVYLLLELCVTDLCVLLYGEEADLYREMPEANARVYAASVALGLRHLHQHGFVFRDLKLENVLIDAKGHTKLTDLGTVRRLRDTPNRRSKTALGTEGYLPPEQIRGRGRNFASDFWALGVLSYELLVGEPPFGGEDKGEAAKKVVAYADSGSAAREGIREAVQSARQRSGGAADAADFVVSLLQPFEAMRLGSGQNFAGLLEHEWFDGFDWVALLERRMPSPYVPPPSGGGSGGGATEISEQVLHEDPDALTPPAVDAEMQELFNDFGPTHNIGCELLRSFEDESDANILHMLGASEDFVQRTRVA